MFARKENSLTMRDLCESFSLDDAMTLVIHMFAIFRVRSQEQKVRLVMCLCEHFLPSPQLSFHCVCVNCVAWGTVCLCAWMMPASLIVQSAINSVKSAGAPMRNKFEYLWARAAKHTHAAAGARNGPKLVGWLAGALSRYGSLYCYCREMFFGFWCAAHKFPNHKHVSPIDFPRRECTRGTHAESLFSKRPRAT